MHRFRKKSDAKRAQVPEHLLAGSNSWSPQPALRNQPHNPPDALPALPPASDFRTSLILPSLSRRFTLLRTSNGAPVSLDDMRSRFAEQRALGAEHQISEEEEDMIVQALGQLQAANVAGTESPIPPPPNNTAAVFSPGSGGTFAAQQDLSVPTSVAGDSEYPSSIRSGIASSVASSPSSTYPRSIPSSPASRASTSPRYSNKRNSNNMFGSGRFHDTSYLRSVSKGSVVSSRSVNSLAGSDSHGGSVRSARSAHEMDAGSGRPVTPDADAGGDPSTSPEKSSSPRTWSISPYSPISALPPRLSKEFTVQQARRTSLALEQVIRGIEEDAEETIMVPRTSLSRAGTVNSRAQSPQTPYTPSAAGTPIPWMTDEARVDDRDDEEPAQPPPSAHPSSSSSASPSPSPRPGTTSPSPRLPGYIPGMPRPLTPRDADSDRDDGATGYSTTPRARSPAQPHHSYHSNHPLAFAPSRHHHHSSISSDGQSILPPSILRSSRGSGTTQVPPLRTTSPGYGGKSRGNSVSSPPLPSPVPSPIPEERFKSDIHSRRPLSPTSGSATVVAYSGSRPGTPSGAGGWPPSSPLAQVHMIPPVPPRGENDSPRPGMGGHSRSGSHASGDSSRGDGMPIVMPLSGPALPDSPFIDGRHGNNGTAFSTFGTWQQNQITSESRNGDANGHCGNEEHRDSSISSLDIGRSSQPARPSAAAAKIAARVPTPVHTHARSTAASESGNGHDPILLHRTVSKRSQKRVQSPTPSPHIQSQPQTPAALHTPSSSSNSSSNVNLNLYSSTSPMFSPMLNTSASSLLSVGSSYHSWADENGKKSGWDQLVEYDSQRSAWQDIMNTGAGGANETDDASETFGSPEQVLHSLTGLTKGDLGTMQTHLVTDALTRKGFEPPRSPTRRRRISTSRASYSAAQSTRESGNNSPAPPPRQATPVAENGHASPPLRHSPENTSRANALLESVMNSIQSQSATSTPPSSDAPSAEPPSSTDDDTSSKFPSLSSSGRESAEDDASALRLKAITDALSVSGDGEKQGSDDPVKPASSALEPSQSLEDDSGEATEVPPSQFWRSPQPPSHGLPNDSVQLARDVSRKAAAATAALKSPSQTKMGEPEGPLRRRTTKRIDLQKISSPHLVSSSTSVNAIPITHQTLVRQVSSPTSDPRSPSKLSQRFKKLRGTLRTRPSTQDGQEVTPFMLPTPTNSSQPPYSAGSHHVRSPSPPGTSQTIAYAHEHALPGAASATEPRRFKVPVPSPPASAGPGIKGFMARFRKPRKETANPGDRSEHQSPEPTSPVSPPREREPSYGYQGSAGSPSPPARASRSRDRVPVSPTNRARSPTPDPVTVNQLFDAATQLGLDQNALNELLARSTSTSSQTTAWTQASTSPFAGVRSNSTVSRAAPLRAREGHSLDLPRTPDQSYRPPARSNTLANRHPEGEIVRRTIIFASDNLSTSELNTLARKDSMPGRPQRSPSATSIHSTGSATREPPVPRLPASLGRTHVTRPSDSSSFYDVYAQEQSFSGVQNGSTEGPSSVPGENVPSDTPLEEQGQGPALEVLQLSNGQVVWSVLDSLRAADEDDSESLFRRSMVSSRGHDASDDLEVRFKEHRRLPSKGSNYSQGSYTSRRRPIPGSSDPRPETKLFKTNSSTIGRLIEDLSKNMDSGSFNFMRPNAETPSTSASFHSDASSHQVERDLEALLNSINPR